MYIKGGSRSNIKFWARHLQDTKENTRAVIVETRGTSAETLRDMMLEMQQDASIAPRCKNFMYIASFNPCPHEQVSEEQRERMIEIFEKQRGIPEGQPRIIVEHEKNGRTHWHVVWLRVDLEKGLAFSDGLNPTVCQLAAKQIELELGLEQTPKLIDRERDAPLPPFAEKFWEIEREKKTGITADSVKAEITAIFQQSEHGADFVNGLEQHGYQFVKGDRAFCVMDAAGEIHSLARRIDGVNTKELKAFMRDVDLSHIPTAEQAKAGFQERKIAGLEADRATVAQEIAWEEKLAQAAIAKEKIEGRFVERDMGSTGGGHTAPHVAHKATEAIEFVLDAPVSVAGEIVQDIGQAARAVSKPLEALAQIAAHGMDMMTDFLGGATAQTPERIQLAAHENKKAAHRYEAALERLDKWSKSRAQTDEVITRTRQQEQKRQEIEDEQRRYHQGQFELDR